MTKSNEDRVAEALRWISGACDVGTDQCPRCGRPTGVLAIKSHADRALAAHEASRAEVSDAEADAAMLAFNGTRNDGGVDYLMQRSDMKRAILAARKEKNDD